MAEAAKSPSLSNAVSMGSESSDQDSDSGDAAPVDPRAESDHMHARKFQNDVTVMGNIATVAVLIVRAAARN